jgi:hypothetical protein
MDANDVLDGWNHEDAQRVLEAVRMAADGLITEGEMLGKLKTAGHKADLPNGDQDTPWDPTRDTRHGAES